MNVLTISDNVNTMTGSHNSFEALYKNICNCKKCPHVQSQKACRLIEKVNTNARAMVISEAMAASQVRLSGVNFFDIHGNIGSTGRMLEKFLTQFGLSVYPDNQGCVYNTEIVHCFPGYASRTDAKSIRRPTNTEIDTCIGQGFISQEIELVSPKVIFLMGKTSYETFYKKFLEKGDFLPLSKKIEDIKVTGKIDSYKGIPLIPIQHASGANPRYNGMLRDIQYISVIKELLGVS